MVSGADSSRASDFFAVDGDARFGFNARGDAAGEFHSVDREGMAGGNGAGVGLSEQEAGRRGASPASAARGGVFRLGLERVGADQLGEVRGLVRLSGADGAHLVEGDFAAESRGLESGFRAG